MSDISAFVSEDSRKPIERLRRHVLHRIADAKGITYPTQAPKTVMIQILEANGVDVTRPPQGVDLQWRVIQGTNSEGRAHSEIYPVIPEHASSRNGVNAEAALIQKTAQEEAEDDARLKALEAENERLREQNERSEQQIEKLQQMIEGRLAALEGEKVPSNYWDLVRYAKDKGVEVPKGMKKVEILKALENLSG